MEPTIHLVDYFYLEAADKPGEAARVLGELKQKGVNLLAFSGFPSGRRAQLDFVPSDGAAFRSVAKQAKWKVTGPKKVFLIQGEDRTGVVTDVLDKLVAANINVTSTQAICAGAGRFGALVWVAPRDVKRAAHAWGVANA